MRVAYEPKIFQELNEFRIAKQRLAESQEKLTELGNVICRHGRQNQVGMSLLHKHYNLHPDERSVEELVDNCSYIKPQTENHWDGATPYLWKAQRNPKSRAWIYYPLEFIRHPSIGAEVEEKAEAIFSDREFLSDMAAKLFELGLTDTFGIAIPHRDVIKLEEGEILVETTDEQTRTLTCSPALASSISLGELTQTLWKFTPKQNVNVLGQCVMHCNAHCHGHCRGHY